MISPSDVFTMASWMAGDFSNWDQAIENPPFFAHIRVCIRPLPVPFSEDGVWLYSEQAYDYMVNRPYRTAILHLTYAGDRLEIANYRVKEASSYFGASRDPERLRSLTLEGVELLCGCKMLVERSPQNTFKGAVEPGKNCRVMRDGLETYLTSEFEITEHRLFSLDRGHDLISDERVWGSVAGPFDFEKKTSFANEVSQS